MMNLPGIDGPLMGRLVPIAESTGIQAESDVFGFAWSEPDFLKSLQLALGALGLGGWIGDIKLGRLPLRPRCRYWLRRS